MPSRARRLARHCTNATSQTRILPSFTLKPDKMAYYMHTHTNQPNQQPNQQSNQQWHLLPMADEKMPLTQQDIVRIYPPKNLPADLVGTAMLDPERFTPPLGTFYLTTKCPLPWGIKLGRRCRGCFGDPALCTVPCQKQCPVCQAGPHILPGKAQLVSFASWLHG